MMKIGAKYSHQMETFANPRDMKARKNVYNVENEWNLVFQISTDCAKHIYISLKKKFVHFSSYSATQSWNAERNVRHRAVKF